jgi:CubicO group peptidase (beta-lactamase class C family)
VQSGCYVNIQRGLSRRATAVVLGWMKSSGLNSSTMSRFLFSVYAIALVLSCTVEPWAQALQQNSQAKDLMRVPGTEWERAKPESLGYSSARLEALRGWLKPQQTDAMMVVVHGKVIFEYGDLSLATKVASVRKSVLGMLYGNYVFSGKIDLDKTVKELGLEDREPFLPIEERATLEQLLTARSGIYLPSGNKDLDLDMPKRQRISGDPLRLQQLGLQRRRHGIREIDWQEYLRRSRIRHCASHRHAGL